MSDGNRLLRVITTIALVLALALSMSAFAGWFGSGGDGGKKAQKGVTVDEQHGRDFRSLSVSPNGEELLLVEVDKKVPEYTRVLRYNLKQNSLQHYSLPQDYVYIDAKLSPSGKYIVMTRIPRLYSNFEAQMAETLESSEIAIMKADGTDFRVLKLSHGFKHEPILSNDDSKVAYWRGSLRPPHSKSLVYRLDIWEVDLKTRADTLFSGHFEFFEGG